MVFGFGVGVLRPHEVTMNNKIRIKIRLSMRSIIHSSEAVLWIFGTLLRGFASIERLESSVFMAGKGVRMRKVLLIFVLLIPLIAACAPVPAATEEPSTVDEQPTSTEIPTDIPEDLTPAQRAAIEALSENLGLPADQIILVSTEEVEWPDGCLGVQMEGLMCTQVITPGFRIVLEANGREVEYRTNEDGTQIRPATVLMTWKREGGIAGFCDVMTVYLSGEVHSSSCNNSQSVEKRLIDVLSEEEIAHLDDWLQSYGNVSIDASDPKGVADRMVVTLEFMGLGNQETVSSENEQQLIESAQSLHQKLYQ